jgi:hypothetical protein
VQRAQDVVVPAAHLAFERVCTTRGAFTHTPIRALMADDQGKALLDRAFRGLEREVPDRATRAIRWLRNPKSRWLRLPLGILCIVASFFWFLPVLGLWFLPLGLLLIAQDVPFLRRPVGRLMLWLEDRWRALRARFGRTR